MIHNEDREVLAKLFNPEQVSYSVYDGANLQRTLISEQNHQFKLSKSSLIFIEKGRCSDISKPFDICISTRSIRKKGFKSKRFRYITNPDGTMRWIFPADLKFPTFLSFYSVTTLKARLFVALCKLLFSLRLQRFFVSGEFTVLSKHDLAFEKLAESIQASGYSIFTGTVGKNRKGIVEFHEGKTVKSFFKMPFDIHSSSIIDQEREVLLQLSQGTIDGFSYPKVLVDELDIPGLLQENIAMGDVERVSHIDARHIAFVDALYQQRHASETPSECLFMRDVDRYLDIIEHQDAIYMSDELLPKLKRVYQRLKAEDTLSTAWAHADFVPWNTFASSEMLHVYDWELSRNYYPVLFDLFHFVFQSGILIERASLEDINTSLERVYALPQFQSLTHELKLNVKTQLSAYLLLNISHYLSIYMEQSRLHKQAYWLLSTWNKALDSLLEEKTSSISHRHMLIRNLLCYLHEQEVDYAVLKIANKDIFQLNSSSDIDLLFKAEAVDAFIENLQQFAYLKRMNISRRSNLVTIELFLEDATFLSLDLVMAFKRRSVVYLDAESVLKRRILDNRGFYRLNYADDLDYMLNFYLLNGEGLPKHYRHYFLDMPEEVQAQLVAQLNQKLQISAQKLDEIFEQNALLAVNIKQSIRGLSQNRGWKRWRNVLQYLNDTQKMVRFSKGFMLTLSGVDGAGKTTLLESTQAYLETTLRRQVVLLRLRPSVLPILSAYKYGKEGAEQRSMSRLPRTGTNMSVSKSLLRFMYYYLDYILGQCMVYFKYVMRGKVVIYDRYYFDFINDPRRMNLELPQWITKLGYRLVSKPRLNLFLYAQPELILARKKELDADTIRQLNERYLANFEEFEKRYRHSQYVCIENVVLEDTEKIIRDYINTIA